jgi:TolA-binding protein
VDLATGNPQLGAAMAPMLIKFRDMPEAEKMSKVAMSLLPPQTQAAYHDDEDGPDISPEAQQQIDQLKKQVDELSHALENAAHEADEKETKETIDTANMQINAYKGVTDRLKVLAPAMAPEQLQAIVRQVVLDDFKVELPELGPDHPAMKMPDPTEPPPGTPPPEANETDQPASAGFSLPEQG